MSGSTAAAGFTGLIRILAGSLKKAWTPKSGMSICIRFTTIYRPEHAPAAVPGPNPDIVFVRIAETGSNAFVQMKYFI
jgi:hypothetical protein